MASTSAYRGGPGEINKPLAELGQRRCREIIEAKKNRPNAWNQQSPLGCWLAVKGLNQAGYGVTKAFTNAQIYAAAPARPSRNSEKNYLLHKIAYAAENGRDLVGVGSHLCGVKSCFNPAHIVDEPQSENISRNYCAGEIRCDQGHVLLNKCIHVVRCLKITVVPCCAAVEAPDAPPPSEWHFSQRDVSALAGSDDFDFAAALGVGLDNDEEDVDVESTPFGSSPPLGPPSDSAAPPLSFPMSDAPSSSMPVRPRGGVAGHTLSSSPPQRESKRLRGLDPSQAPPEFQATSSDVGSSEFVVEDEE